MSDVILITGASGFVGFKTLTLALEAGYTVRAVVRKEEQVEKLKSHPKVAPRADKLQFVVVPDLAKPGAFDQAFSNVSAVLHLASPLANKGQGFEEDLTGKVIKPALDVTTTLIDAALKFPSVKRVVVTSSAVTLVPFEWLFAPDDKLYTADNVNRKPNLEVSTVDEAYWTSKALARLAVHDYIKSGKLHFDIVQLMPSVIIGADDRALTLADLKNNYPIWDLKLSPVLGTTQNFPMVNTPIDVYDVAKAHVDALNMSVPGNVDYNVSAETPEGNVWDSMIDVAKKYFPGHAGGPLLPLGGTLPTMKFRIDARPTEEAFGWRFSSYEDTMRRMIGQYIELANAEKGA